MWFRQKPKNDPAETMRSLRERALTVTAPELKITPTEARRRVWGVVMETGYSEAVASLITLADGSTSLYFSNGGGIIGAGEHAAVRAASDALMSAAETHLEKFSPAQQTPQPAVGSVRFYVRTFNRLLTAEASEAELGEGRHPLSPVFYAGHGAITEVRVTSEPA